MLRKLRVRLKKMKIKNVGVSFKPPPPPGLLQQHGDNEIFKAGPHLCIINFINPFWGITP